MSIMPALRVWTAEDTSEAGPTLDDEEATIEVDWDIDGATLHLAGHDERGGLWTVAIELPTAEAADLSRALAVGPF